MKNYIELDYYENMWCRVSKIIGENYYSQRPDNILSYYTPYLPTSIRRAKDRYMWLDKILRLFGIFIKLLKHNSQRIINQCKLVKYTRNKAITLYIKYGVRYY